MICSGACYCFAARRFLIGYGRGAGEPLRVGPIGPENGLSLDGPDTSLALTDELETSCPSRSQSSLAIHILDTGGDR